jgi:glutamine---fructose-6-phosphate transaminase (isomerizing)
MCGIVGYVGKKEATPFLVAGLRRLEYRGYDSAGIATLPSTGGTLQLNRAVGKIDRLAESLDANPSIGTTGIGHTRWATHGPATTENAHPHIGGRGLVAVVHNGVIENYQVLKEALIEKGYMFQSATDTEVISHLIADNLKTLLDSPAGSDAGANTNEGPNAVFVEAVRAALPFLRGTYGLVVMFRDRPELLVAARCGSPLVLGVGRGEQFIASDSSALIGHTERIIYLADHQIAVITSDSIQVVHRDQGRVRPEVRVLENRVQDVSTEGYEHYMLKEIYEQPTSLRNAMRGRLDRESATAKFGGLNLTPAQLRGVNRLILTACGTSWHSSW